MTRDHDTAPGLPPIPVVRGIGLRLLLWIATLFLVTLAVFVGLDVRHESEVMRRLGATQGRLATFRTETLRIHAVHGGVTIVLFAAGIYSAVRVLVTRRIREILQAIHRFRHGTWSIRLPEQPLDEIECVADAFRQLGPQLERTLTTFVDCDRKATVARLGIAYDRAVSPLASRILVLDSAAPAETPEPTYRSEVRQLAMRILAELGSLGNPEHPAVSGILQPLRPPARTALGSIAESIHSAAPLNDASLDASVARVGSPVSRGEHHEFKVA